IGNDYVTEVDIIDRNEDGDSDDTKEDLVLMQGQSYIVYLKENGVNDDYGGTAAAMGDYFRINGNRRILTMIGTTSDWEFDYVPPYFRSDGSVDFFVFIPHGSDADEWGIDVIGYKDNTSVIVKDITNTPTTTSGYTSVVSVGSGTQICSETLDKGEDLLIYKGVDVFSGIDPRGRTFYIHADDSVAVIAGALRQAHSARDGASYVKRYDGLNVGKEFYFYIPLEEGRNNEKEIRVNTYSEAAIVNLSCWNGSQWVALATNESMTAYDHFDYIGSNSAGYSQNFFKLTSTGKVGVFTATWLETGASGTSDMATYMSSEYGYGAGHNYVVYLGPPGTQINGERWSHAYITSIDTNATVTIKDMDTDGTIINEIYTLNAAGADTNNEFWDFKINPTTWNLLNAGDNRPYVKIYSEKEIRVFSSNWNDNWFAYAAGIVVPQYSEVVYENFPYKRWVFLGLPLETGSDNPDDIFGPYFGGAEWDDETTSGQNTNWRFSRWDIEWNTYVRWGEADYDGGWHGDPPNPQPGFGYWFFNSYASAVDFYITGSPVDTTTDYYIPINPPQGDDHPGLNQLANPLPMVIDWKDAQVEVTTTSGTVEKTLLEANSEGLISQWAHRWNGYEYIPYNATNGGDFLIWDGFWVEQLTDSIGSSSSTVDYTVGQTSNWVYSTIFYDPSTALGDGQTDQFQIDFTSQSYPRIYARTYIGDLNQVSGWTCLNTVQGVSAVTTQGFRITLTEKSDIHYLFEVTGSSNTSSLYGVEFYCYVYKTAPLTGSTYTATRTGDVGESAVTLRLKVPPIDVDLRKSVPANNLNPFQITMDTESGDWFASLSVKNSDNSIRDSYNGFGHQEGSCTIYDVNDARNITPYLDSFIDIYFPHNDQTDIYNYWEDYPLKACYDMRPGVDTTRWDFKVSIYNFSNQSCTICWDLEDVHDDVQLTLINTQTQTEIDMMDVNEYSITTPSGSGFQTMDFQVLSVRTDLIAVGIDPVETTPASFSLGQNYPNPFNPTTTIQYHIPRNEWVQLDIYNLQGELVKTLWSGDKAAGDYRVQWNGTDKLGRPVASGIYLSKLVTPTMTASKKMLLLK
ncbi:MAG: T9SS type A sorting domain-containing protein, partial [Candidatus Marinimicrobia bacterium]|nr:T9SS type A sorting domain-containing protein [Candidatus Neomarinimicrobiota bacterium]